MRFFFEHGRTLFERVALESRYLSDVSLNLIERDFDDRLGMFSGMPLFLSPVHFDSSRTSRFVFPICSFHLFLFVVRVLKAGVNWSC